MTLAAAKQIPPVRPSGQTLFPPAAWDLIVSKLRLSAREQQIVLHVIDDQKERAIARHLKISPHTVHTYLQRLYHKLDVASRVELVVRVFSEHPNLQATPANPPAQNDSGIASPPKR